MEQDMTQVLIMRRRKEYEDALSREPFNYDIWFDLVFLEEDKVQLRG